MPVDEVPTEAGNLILRMGPGLGQETAHVETAEERAARLANPIAAARVAFVSHFATCPYAVTHRRKPKPS